MSSAPAVPGRPPDLDNTPLRMLMGGGTVDQAAFADDLVVDDRRAGVSLPLLHGPEEVIEASRVQDDLFGPTVIEAVATRGDRLALVKTRSIAESGFELVSYGIFETNEAAQFRAMVFFDETDLDTALTELGVRYLSGEGAAHADLLHVCITFADAIRRDDFDFLRGLVSPEFVAVDHTPLGFGTGNCEYFIEASRTRQQVATDGIQILRTVEADQNAVLGIVESNRITAQGNEYESVSCVLIVVDSSNHICRAEWFAEEQYADARARLDELAAVPRNLPHEPLAVDNPVVRLVTKLLELLDRGDWTAAGELDAVADTIERFDRRHGVSAPWLRGAEAFGLNAAAFFDVFESVTCEPVAVRGESLALIRLHCGQADGFQLLLLCLYECDGNGRLVYEADYDDDDLAAALDELDERYIAGEGADHEYLVRRLGDYRHAWAARDWAAYEVLVHPEFTFVDHRPIGQGSGTRDRLLTSLRALIELAPAMTSVEPSLLINGDVALTRVRDRATNAEGNEYEWEHFVVQQFVAGLLIRAELFPLDAYTEALARFDELSAR